VLNRDPFQEQGEVQWAAERRLKKAGMKTDLSHIQPLEDYVEFFCRTNTQVTSRNPLRWRRAAPLTAQVELALSSRGFVGIAIP
jgi:hypothetical protein